jgi:hypothetical protein
MYERRIKTIVLLALLALLGACSSTSQLLSKDNYQTSLRAFGEGNLVKARDYHPSGERGAFITTMERTYLDLLNGKPNIDDLQAYAKVVSERVRYDVSRELDSFFYLQTPEDYYASEHEVIWMHLLLSWGYSMRHDYENACVESRLASHLLSYSWSGEGRFDDPSLRLVSGFMWALCGDWDEAVVDFRAAQYLDPELDWLAQLSERRKPPRHLIVGFGGIGPEPLWKPDFDRNLRALRNIKFKFNGAQSLPRLIADDGTELVNHRGPSSAPWYKRHIERDSAIHEMIEDSRYGAEVMGRSTITAAEISANAVAGGLWIAGGVVLGAGVVYLGIEGNSGDMVMLGVGIAGASIVQATDFVKKRNAESMARTKQDLDYATRYRFVRYLPEYVWMSWDDSPTVQFFTLYPKQGRPKRITVPLATHEEGSIYFYFDPDVNYYYR